MNILHLKDIVRISKYKRKLKKAVFKIQNSIINDLKGWRNCWNVSQLHKANQKEFRFEKVIKTKGDKIYVKCKG